MEKIEALQNLEDEDTKRFKKISKVVFEVKNEVLVLENLDLSPELILGILIKFPF